MNSVGGFEAVFEGSEKKLEIVFQLKKNDSLRFLPISFWSSVVEATGAQILSQLSNLDVDAYLLSESSLFVFRDRILMITCGRTRLIEAAKKVIRKLGMDSVSSIFFERKNEAFPHAQLSCFEEDVAVLKEWFPQGGVQTIRYEALGGFIQLFHYGVKAPSEDQARTFELLMHDLDPRVIDAIQNTSRTNRAKWSRAFHFDSIFAGFLVDEFWFEPCGYSLNGIKGDEYFTIHITPESTASYVSLETNRRFGSCTEFKRAIQTVLNVFKPKTSLLAQFCHLNGHVHQPEWTHPQFLLSNAQTMELDPGLSFCFHAIERKRIELPMSANAAQFAERSSVWINS